MWKLNSFSPKNEFGLVLKKTIFKFSQCIFFNIILLFRYYLFKLESLSPNDALCQVWLKLTQWFWKKKEILISMYFRYIISISPWKRGAFHLNKFESSPKDTLCQFWLKLAQWFWRRRRICEKYKTATKTTTTTTTMTNNGQQSEKLTWAFGSG